MARNTATQSIAQLLELMLRSLSCALDAELLASLIPLDADRLPGICGHRDSIECVLLKPYSRPEAPPRLHVQLSRDIIANEVLMSHPSLENINDKSPPAGAILQVARSLILHLLARDNSPISIAAAEDVAQSTKPESLALVFDVLEPEGFEFAQIMEGIRAFHVSYHTDKSVTIRIAPEFYQRLTGKATSSKVQENGRLTGQLSSKGQHTPSQQGSTCTGAGKETIMVDHLSDAKAGTAPINDGLLASQTPNDLHHENNCVTSASSSPAQKCMRDDAAEQALLESIVHIMEKPKNRTVGYKELNNALNWSENYAATYGSLTDFASRYPRLFQLKCGCMTLRWDAALPKGNTPPTNSKEVADRRVEAEKLEVISVYLKEQGNNSPLLTDLPDCISWDQKWGDLCAFVKDHPESFVVHHGRVALAPLPMGQDQSELQNRLPHTEGAALAAIVAALNERLSHEAGVWELIQHVHWDKDFGHLGKLSDFIARHPEVLHCRHGAVLLAKGHAKGDSEPMLSIQEEDRIKELIAHQLSKRDPPCLHIADLAKLLDWGRQFPHVQLRDFCEHHRDCFDYMPPLVALKKSTRRNSGGKGTMEQLFSSRQHAGAEYTFKEEREALVAISNQLATHAHHPGKGHCAWLVRQLDWDNAFPNCGKLADFCQAHPNWFDVQNSFIALQPTAPINFASSPIPSEEDIPRRLTTKKDAQYAIASTLATSSAGELSYWELAAALDWDQNFGHLGTLSQLAEDCDWFESKLLTVRLYPSTMWRQDVAGSSPQLRVEMEVILEIADYLKRMGNKEVHTTELFRALRWESCFLNEKVLVKVLQRHQNWFRVEDGVISLTPHGLRNADIPQTSERLALEESALKAIAAVLIREPAQTMDIKHLMEQVLWDYVFCLELGPLLQFLEQWPNWFDVHQRHVTLQHTAPLSTDKESEHHNYQGDAEEALQAISQELLSRRIPGRHLTSLLKALDWDARFPTLGRLFDFVENHPDWFIVRNGVVFLRGANGTLESHSEEEALQLITQTICRNPGSTMGVWELVNEVSWDTVFPDLGKLSTFLERYPEHFSVLRGWVSLQPNAPPIPTTRSSLATGYIDGSSDAGLALRAIVNQLRTRHPPKMHREELLKSLEWDVTFPNLGKLSDFTEDHSAWFLTRGGFIILKDGAPFYLLDQSNTAQEGILHIYPTLEALIQSTTAATSVPSTLPGMQMAGHVEAEVEALTTLAEALQSRRPPATCVEELEMSVNWVTRFSPNLGPLAAFVTAHPQRFGVQDGIVTLLSVGESPMIPNPNPLPPLELNDQEVHALHDIVKVISTRRGSKTWLQDLDTQLGWNQRRSQLGQLQEFLQRHQGLCAVDSSVAWCPNTGILATEADGIQDIIRFLREAQTCEVALKTLEEGLQWAHRYRHLGPLNRFVAQHPANFALCGDYVLSQSQQPSGPLPTAISACRAISDLLEHRSTVCCMELGEVAWQLDWDGRYRHLGQLEAFVQKHSNQFVVEGGLVMLHKRPS